MLGVAVFALAAANSIRQTLSRILPEAFAWASWQRMFGVRGALLIVLLSMVLFAAAFALRPWGSLRIARLVLLILLPLLPVNFLLSLTFLAFVDRSSWEPLTVATSPFLATNPSRRVVVVLFDEWDYQISFEHLPAGLRLPALDTLKSESTCYSNAHPAANSTIVSIPSLTTGLELSAVSVHAPNEIRLSTSSSGKSVPWTNVPNIFTRARDLGLPVAILGWYIPYCRLFGSVTCKCANWQETFYAFPQGKTLQASLKLQLQSLLESGGASLVGPPIYFEPTVRTHREMFRSATRFVADPSLGFVYLHIPSTHIPHFYDQRTGDFTRHRSSIANYADSLVYTDRVVAALRQAMISSGVWDKTTLILTSDHPLRSPEVLGYHKDSRVPLLIREPGQEGGAVSAEWISAKGIHALIQKHIGLAAPYNP